MSMLTTLHSGNRPGQASLTIVLLLAYVAAAILLFAGDYLILDGPFVLGCALAPYLFIVRQKGHYSGRYVLPAILLGLLAAWAPVKTFQYLAIAFAFLFLLEIRLGKLNPLPVMLMVLLSPVFRYVTEVFGFPIRLQLSQWAGWLISRTGYVVEVKGNVLFREGFSFAVDPACVGLQLVTVSFLIALFLLAHFERSTGKKLPLWLTGTALLATGGLVVLANLVRIVLLVVFKILPAHPLHDLTGLVCLAVYVILPVVFLFGWFYRRKGEQPVAAVTAGPQPRFRTAGPVVLLAALVVLPFLRPAQPPRPSGLPFRSLPEFRCTVVADGITKFEGAEALVYVKPIAAFYSTEHSPLICWRGSGYSFSRINRQRVRGQAVYTGVLAKGADVLYTAWWFDNGRHCTISQWEWRRRMLLGAPPYSLVNVSAASLPDLQEAIATALKREQPYEFSQ